MSLQFVHSHDSLQREFLLTAHLLLFANRTNPVSTAHSAATWGVAVTATNDVLSTSLDGTLALHASSSSSPGARVRTFPAHPLAWVSLSVATPTSIGDVHSDVARRALVNSIAGTTVLVDYTTGEELGRKVIGEKESGPGTKSGWAEPAWSVSLCADGKTYASTGASGAITLHSATPSSNASFTPVGDDEAFGTRLAHIQTGRSKFGLYLEHSPVDPTRIAMSNEAGQVFMVDTVKQVVTNSWASHAMPARCLGWSGDGNLLMSASDDRRLVLYDARSSSPGSGSGSSGSTSAAVAHLSGHTHSVLAVALSPGDGRLALSGGRDGTVRVWDVGMRKAVGVVREGGAVWSVKWRPMAGDVKVEEADVKMEEGTNVPDAAAAAGGIGGSGAMGFVTGGEEGMVRWYRGAGMV